MRVGDDVSAGVDDDSGSAASLEDRIARSRSGAVVRRRVTGDEDLNNTRADTLREILERFREVGLAGTAALGRRGWSLDLRRHPRRQTAHQRDE